MEANNHGNDESDEYDSDSSTYSTIWVDTDSEIENEAIIARPARCPPDILLRITQLIDCENCGTQMRTKLLTPWYQIKNIPIGEHWFDKHPPRGFENCEDNRKFWRHECLNCHRKIHTGPYCDQCTGVERCIVCSKTGHTIEQCNIRAEWEHDRREQAKERKRLAIIKGLKEKKKNEKAKRKQLQQEWQRIAQRENDNKPPIEHPTMDPNTGAQQPQQVIQNAQPVFSAEEVRKLLLLNTQMVFEHARQQSVPSQNAEHVQRGETHAHSGKEPPKAIAWVNEGQNSPTTSATLDKSKGAIPKNAKPEEIASTSKQANENEAKPRVVQQATIAIPASTSKFKWQIDAQSQRGDLQKYMEDPEIHAIASELARKLDQLIEKGIQEEILTRSESESDSDTDNDDQQ